MAKNDFKPFATAASANVTPQSEWESLPALLSGFTSGKASSAQINKALRQSTFISAALAQFVADKSNSDVIDNGDFSGFVAKLSELITAGDDVFLRKDQDGADIPDKAQFRQNVGLVKQTGQFDATAGSVMLNGAWGLGGAGRTIALGDADFITWLRSVGNGSQTFRNTNANSYTKQYGSTILAKAGDTWGTVSVGYTSSANINNNGVRIAGGTVDGLHNNIYELWTDKNLPNPATLDTDQTITGKKIFNRDNEAIQLKPLTDTQSCFIRGQKSGDTPHWYIGKAGGDYAVAWANQHATSLNSITLREDGNTHITVASGKNVNVVIGGAAGRVLSQGHNAESDANGIWKVPGSAGLTPAAIGALAVSDLAGIPLPFPGSVAPSGWLKCNGQSFNTTQYPVLASRYPSGVLPDLRAEFIRGADDGRGVDTGRALLSAQGDAIRNITGKFANNGLAFAEGTATSVGEGAFTRLENNLPSNGGFGTVGCHYTFDASKVVPTASENRPRNIAFNYIVRAA